MPTRPLPPVTVFSRGITLLEILIVLLVAALVIGTATPAYLYLIDSRKTSLAAEEITGFARRIDRFQRRNNRYPDTLEEALDTAPVDPWGNPYRYLNLNQAGGTAGRSADDLRPLNTDYDLYSEGPDTTSLSPIGAEPSRDDIVRARNGNYIGIAADYR